MEKAIKKAIEGGYERKNGSFSLPMKLNDEFDIWEYDNNTILLDPLFWQALGKTEGWDENETHWQGGDFVGKQSIFEWHNFIDHIAQGKEIDEFFNKLLKVE